MRFKGVTLLLTFLFGAYGLKELVEAWRHGTSAGDGIEALILAAVMFAVFLLMQRVTRRRRDEPMGRL